MSKDVRLNLTPERTARTASGSAHLRDGHAEDSNEFETVSEPEAHSF